MGMYYTCQPFRVRMPPEDKMHLVKRLAIPILAALLLPSTVLSEGLERANIDTSFMYEDGAYGEIAFGQVNPSIPATLNNTGTKLSNVAKSFNVNTVAAKMPLGDSFEIGLWRTNNGNGVSLDWAPLGVSAEFTIASTVGLVRYKFSDNLSLIGGLKRIQSESGATFSSPLSAAITASNYSVGSANTTVGVYGAAYEQPEIGLRIELLAESAGTMSIPVAYSNTTAGGTNNYNGVGELGLGDALTLKFQSGIAPDTLLFGSVRNSKWKNNQVKVPVLGGSTASVEISTFKDGQSYTLGLGRKFGNSLSGTLSAFFDPDSDCGDVSALAPTCENKAVSVGAKISLSGNADLNLGTTWSQRGDATVRPASINATTSKNVVTSFGAKISYKF